MCGFYGIVHQDDLDLEEKILRHFDLSSQYGVCLMHYVETPLREALLISAAVHWCCPGQALATGEYVEAEPAYRSPGGASAGRERERAGARG